jgi:hypothetical protein
MDHLFSAPAHPLYQEVERLRVDGFSGDPLDEITPAMVLKNEKVADSLYLDLIWEPVPRLQSFFQVLVVTSCIIVGIELNIRR